MSNALLKILFDTPKLLSIRQAIPSVEEDVEKREPFYTAGGDINWCIHYGKQYGGSSRNE